MTTNDKVLVPREPTAEMLDAFQEELCRWSNITRADDRATAALWKAMLAAATQPAEDGLPGLPEGLLLTATGRLSYTADQMLAFRAEGIAYAQQRSAGVVVDEAFDAWLARDYPLYEKNNIVVHRMRAAWNAALTAALSREDGK